MEEEIESESKSDSRASSSILSAEQSQTVAFVDGDAGLSLPAPPIDSTMANVDGTRDIQLGSFLSRPTLVDTISWTTSDLTGVKLTTNPWSDFLSNAVIKRKLDNYAFLRGKLHLKFLLNGTPFQYGLMRTCYAPLEGIAGNRIRTNPTSALPLLVPYSQQPGVWLHPQDNAGGEMDLPFFYHKNWLDITSSTDVTNMGTLRYVIYAPLRVASSGGTTTVTVQTYAWMTDVELMASTSKLSLQGDEYVEGAISGPATAVARFAGNFSKIPGIGKFARATEIGASAVAGIARLFGYTNAPVIAEVHGFHPMNAPMLASAHISVPAQKLTLDPKQELSIDPSMHGLGDEDELAIQNIVSRESFVGSTTWATTDAIDLQLFNMRINPFMGANISLTNTSSVEVARRMYLTPLAYVSGLFDNWRGSIILHLKVVCSKFHKGRLKISYDPLNDISSTSPGENSVYTHILDIGEQNDLEIEIPYHQATSWLQIDHGALDNWTPGNANAPRLGYDNGLLTIRTLTNLVAPTASSIYLLLSVKAGPDFEFANPRENVIGNNVITHFDVQGAEEIDQVPSRWVVGDKSQPDPNRYGMNFGEEICSLRNILHRASTRDTVWCPDMTASSVNFFRKTYRIMPNVPGYDASAPTTANKILAASGTAPFSYLAMHPMNWISSMFVGYRGSGTFTVTPSWESPLQDFRVYRTVDDIGFNSARSIVKLEGSYSVTSTLSVRSQHMLESQEARNGLSGMAITATQTNGSLQFNLPDNKKYNFSIVSNGASIAGLTDDGTRNQAASLQFFVKTTATSDLKLLTLQTEECAGPDFTCLFFLCTPTVDIMLVNPTAP